MRSVAASAALAMLLVACAMQPADPYPLPTMPPHVFARVPAVTGEAAPTTVLFLTPRPGDEIELLAAEPIGVAEGATVRFYFSPPVLKPDGTHLIGEALQDLAGATFSTTTGTDSPDNTVGIVAEITAQRPGRYELDNVRLHYRINGGSERVGDGISVVFVVCADDPKPARCDET
jgi:hypothetical protein